MAAKTSIGLLKLSESLGIPLGFQLHELLPMVRAVHDHRKSEGKRVSRTSLLYSGALIEPEVDDALADAGLDRAAWEKQLGVEGFDAEPHRPPTMGTDSPPPKDLFEVDPETIGPSLEAYRDRFPGGGVTASKESPPRPLDALGLAYGIVAAVANGSARSLSQETSAGLDAGRAAALLAERIRMLHHVPLEEIERFSLSWVAQEAITRAVDVIKEQVGAGVPMTTSLLLIGFELVGREESDPNAAWFVARLLEGQESQYTSFAGKAKSWVAWYLQTPRWLLGDEESPPLASGALIEAFERAQRIAIAVRGDETIHGRDLLGALLAGASGDPDRPSGVRDLLEEIGFTVERVVEAFLDYLREQEPPTGGDSLEAWRLMFHPEERMVLGMPQFEAEGFEGPDLLGITRDVNAFANLLAAESLEPPLAIGLFGDWGSGKSFFMQKLRRRIDELAAAADRHGRGETAFLVNVVQIEFNAWHYVDTNLWASLVTHIFERLHHHFVPKEEEERQSWERLLAKLDEAIDLRTDAEQTLVAARGELATAEERSKRERVGLGRAVQAVWAAVRESPQVADRLKKDLERMEKMLGAEALREVREELILRPSEARDLARRLPLFRQTVLRGLGSLRTLGPAALVVLAAVLLAWWLPLIPNAGEALEGAAARIAEIVALAGGVGAWLGTAFRRASQAMTAVERVEESLDQALEGIEEEKLADLRRAERAVAAADEAVVARRRQIAELRQRVEELRPAQRLSNFLAERASSTDYRRHLGLAALIRRDFERLHGLMRPQSFSIPTTKNAAALDDAQIPDDLRREVRRYDVDFDHGVASDSDSGTAKDAVKPQAASGGEPSAEPVPELGVFVEAPGRRWKIKDPANSRTIEIERRRRDAGADGDTLRCTLTWTLPHIDRIILYIDDLDRCPPERVVEVLQAVHLLLAFPLFVVVVGVDARWVSRSLALRFKDLWRQVAVADGEDAAGDPDATAATPQDYLEKIFQVPFWLEPMSVRATRNYIDGLVAGSMSGTGMGDGGEGDGGARRRTARTGSGGRPAGDGAGRGEDGDAPAGSSDEGTEEQTDTPGGGSSLSFTGAARPLSGAGTGGGGLGEDELMPSSLELKGEERAFMRQLAPLIGRSARAVKRYVNVYRLIRAGISEDRLKTFLGTSSSPGPYRAVLFLLGVVVGAPAAAEAFFSELRDGTRERTLVDLMAAVRARVQGAAAEADCNRLEALLRDVPQELRESLRVRDMADYRRQVGRYSFRVGRS